MTVASRLLLLVALATIACGPGRRAAFIRAFENRLEVLDEAGLVIRTVRADLGPSGAFSVDRQIRFGVWVEGKCGSQTAGALRLVDLTTYTSSSIPVSGLLPYRLSPGEVEVYSDPAVSPSGQAVAFVVRPCNKARTLDAVESAGLIAVFDRGAAKARLLKGGFGESGDALGFAMNPTWSDDERFLLVNYESGFRVFQVSDGTVVGGILPPGAADQWSSADGWIGSKCVVYLQGKDFRLAEANARMVVNVRTKMVAPLASVVGSDKALKPYTVRWPFALSKVGRGAEVHMFMTSGRRDHKLQDAGTGVQILPGFGNSELPRFCR